MMDHARHLSSPSPTSPFLFHHSERSFKSNPLMPLLSSAAEVTSVDDCFSTSSSTLNSQHHQAHNPFGVDNHHQHHNPLVDSHHHHHHHHHNHHHGHHHNHHQSSQQRDQCTIDQDSLTGVDDDEDGMHNMLSGSSSSSNSTMPLLTESHSHHSFSRISLEEYSPLSLVEDCDNALPISPTSLACGSHHSFKSSLNGLKMDNLVGDVGDINDDDVNDARSLSPSLLSSTNSHHHHHHHHHHSNHQNLWSNSSTAITQNPSLLNSTSTSFLMSQHHHHHHQLSSLIQQLEPQSLDESPPFVGSSNSNNQNNNNNANFEFNLINSNASNHRPSSEPPLNSTDQDRTTDADCKSLASQPVQLNKSTSKQSGAKTSNNSNSGNKQANSGASIAPAPSTRARRTRNRASNVKQQQANKRNNNNDKSANDLHENITASTSNQTQTQPAPQIHSSKLHLQLNHSKKLQELQRRLFGPQDVKSVSADNSQAANKEQQPASANSTSSSQICSVSVATSTCTTGVVSDVKSIDNLSIINVKQEPDSSVAANEEQATLIDARNSIDNSNDNTNATLKDEASKKTTRTRPTRTRKSRAGKSGNTCNASSSSTNLNGLKGSQKTVTTETAEPDTTTKSSDCIKLVDLLSNNNNNNTNGNNNNNEQKNTFIVSGFASTSEAGDSEGCEKKVQQIQLQVGPSLTVLANGGSLMQPINIQAAQNQLQLSNNNNNNNGIVTSGATFTNQIICRTPQSAGNNNVSLTNVQLKGLMSNAELLKGGETLLTNWTMQSANNQTSNSPSNSNNNNNSNSNNIQTACNNLTSNGQPIGTHQIAIQVICQDGTSLVLPVSSAASLNNAVSLSSQHQQLQAVLASNANQQQRNNNNNNSNNQLLPLVSVSNIVAQQATNNSGADQANSSSSQNSGTQTSGLAASSPTLAALLDAGSAGRANQLDLSSASINFNNQNFVPANLLRKLVRGNSGAEMRSRATELPAGTTISLANCTGSLVTVCAPNNSSNATNCSSHSGSGKANGNNVAEKRIKLENVAASLQSAATFTIIDPQGLIVANGNQLNGADEQKTVTFGVASNATSKQTSQTSTSSSGNSISNQQNKLNSDASAVIVSTTPAAAAKQTKMGSSTGNRQVDPNQPFRCEHCNSTFTRLGNFTRHKKIHTVPTKDGQRFKCDVCSKSFLQRCDLARHLHIHRGTEPHRCNICGKGYIRHSDLVTHQRFHNKEKPFGCPHCAKGFCQRGDLNRHLRSIHLQMKPILCPCCNRKFAKQETLLRHLNTAHRSKSNTITTTATSTANLTATTNNTSTLIDALPPNYTITQQQQQQGDDDKQTTISVVTSAAVLNNNNINNNANNSSSNINDTSSSSNDIKDATQPKNEPLVSLQAIQATPCQVPQSADPSTTSDLKATQAGSEQDQAEQKVNSA